MTRKKSLFSSLVSRMRAHHQIKSSNYQITKSSNHQIIKTISNQKSISNQIIKSVLWSNDSEKILVFKSSVVWFLKWGHIIKYYSHTIHIILYTYYTQLLEMLSHLIRVLKAFSDQMTQKKSLLSNPVLSIVWFLKWGHIVYRLYQMYVP